MRIFKSFIAAVGILFCSGHAMAQTEANEPTRLQQASNELGFKPYPHDFIQLQGGIGTVLSDDVRATKLITPTFGIAYGKMFTPYLGARLHVNGWKGKGGVKDIAFANGEMKYNFNYINPNIDIMVDLVNIFAKKVYNPMSLYLIGGIGLNYAWDYDEYERLTSNNHEYSQWSGYHQMRSNQLSHTIRVGLLADYNLSKHWSIGAEVDVNYLCLFDERFDSKYMDKNDYRLTAFLTLTYKWGRKKYTAPTLTSVGANPVYQDTNQADAATVSTPVPVVVKKEDVKAEDVKEPAPAVVQPIKEVIFYERRGSDVTGEHVATIEKVADWCKKNPTKMVRIEGYADKGTGTAERNMQYSQLRAEKVAAALTDKGVRTDQMTVTWHGDADQPFADNDKNRCVVINGE